MRSRDTVDRCVGTSLHFQFFFWGWSPAEGFVVAVGVEGDLAEQVAGPGEHPLPIQQFPVIVQQTNPASVGSVPVAQS
jgi:hypothetical protein